MEPADKDFDEVERRRRRRLLFRHSKIPVRMLVPNFFTLVSLCAGVTAIRMAIEQKYELAVLLVVAAALLDGVDGRLARALKAQSKFGAELDSLADFVNFGVAPAIIIYTWGLTSIRGFGWIAALVFACCMGLRLARFNSMLEVDKPKWQSNFFTGVPAPAGAILALFPFYLSVSEVMPVRIAPFIVAVYTLVIAFMLVSTIPTYSGKLLGERIGREWVLPIFAGAALLVGLFVTYPYDTLAAIVVGYLIMMPMSFKRFRAKLAADERAANTAAGPAGKVAKGEPDGSDGSGQGAGTGAGRSARAASDYIAPVPPTGTGTKH